jgi:hypothetical protein
MLVIIGLVRYPLKRCTGAGFLKLCYADAVYPTTEFQESCPAVLRKINDLKENQSRKLGLLYREKKTLLPDRHFDIFKIMI